MDQELALLIEQLRELTPALRSMGETQATAYTRASDRFVASMAKVVASMEKSNQTRAQQQRATEKFIREVEKAADATEEYRQEQERLAREQEDAARAAEELAGSLDRASRASDADRNRAALRMMRDQRRAQFDDQREVTAGRLFDEFGRGTTLMGAAREGLENLGGTSIGATAGLRLFTAGIEGAGKALLSYAKAMYDGEQGAAVAAKSVKEFADTVSNAAMAIGTAMMLIPKLGIAARVAGAAVTALGGAAKLGAEATKLAAEQSDRLYKNYQVLGKSGVTAADGMMGLAEDAQRLGYGLNDVDLAAFQQTLGGASKDLAMLSGSAVDGRRSFARFSGDITRSELGEYFMNLGMSVDEINAGTAGFVKQQVNLGRAQGMTQAQLTQGAVKYLKELDVLTKLTGMQKQELEAQMDSNRRNERFRAAIEKVRAEQGDEAARNLEMNMAVASERFPGLAKGLMDISAGFVNTEEAQKVFRAGMQDVPMLMTKGLGSGFQEMGQAAQRTTDAFGHLAAVGAYGDVFGDYYESMKAAGMSNEDAAKRALELAEIQKKQGEGADAATKAQTELRRSQMNARDDLQNMVKTGVVSATNGLNSFGKAAETVADSIRKMFGIKTPASEFKGQVDPEQVKKSQEQLELAKKRSELADKNLAAARAELEELQKQNASFRKTREARIRVFKAQEEQSRAQTALAGATKRARAAAPAAQGAPGAPSAGGTPSLGTTPALGTPSTTPATAPSTTSPTTGATPAGGQDTAGATAPTSDLVPKLLDFIGKIESRNNYNVLVGGKTKSDPALTDMTVAQVQEFQSKMLGMGRESTAVGKYQIIRKTLAGLIEEGVVKPSDKFDAATQDKLAIALLERRGLRDYQSGKIKPNTFADNLAMEWASLPMSNNRSYYADIGSNKSGVDRDAVMQVIAAAKGGVAQGPKLGYPAVLHGTEAVVPLPDGKHIPVDIKNFDIRKIIDSMMTKKSRALGFDNKNISVDIKNFDVQKIMDTMMTKWMDPSAVRQLQGKDRGDKSIESSFAYLMDNYGKESKNLDRITESLSTMFASMQDRVLPEISNLKDSVFTSIADMRSREIATTGTAIDDQFLQELRAVNRELPTAVERAVRTAMTDTQRAQADVSAAVKSLIPELQTQTQVLQRQTSVSERILQAAQN